MSKNYIFGSFGGFKIDIIISRKIWEADIFLNFHTVLCKMTLFLEEEISSKYFSLIREKHLTRCRKFRAKKFSVVFLLPSSHIWNKFKMRNKLQTKNMQMRFVPPSISFYKADGRAFSQIRTKYSVSRCTVFLPNSHVKNSFEV